jgi:hypothetical protein
LTLGEAPVVVIGGAREQLRYASIHVPTERVALAAALLFEFRCELIDHALGRNPWPPPHARQSLACIASRCSIVIRFALLVVIIVSVRVEGAMTVWGRPKDCGS